TVPFPEGIEAPKLNVEPTYKHKAPIEDEAAERQLYERFMDQTMTVSAQEILQAEPGLHNCLDDDVKWKRVVNDQLGIAVAEEYVPPTDPSATSYMLEANAFYHQVLHGTIPPNVNVARDIASLRCLVPVIEGNLEVECILDSGCQIVAMSEDVW